MARDRKQVVRRGTPVVMFGGYVYDERRPWMRLPDDPHATRLSPEALEATIAAYFFCGPPLPDPEGPPIPAPRARARQIAERPDSP